jgi:hypothetical protein
MTLHPSIRLRTLVLVLISFQLYRGARKKNEKSELKDKDEEVLSETW